MMASPSQPAIGWLVRIDLMPGFRGKVLRAPIGRAEPCVRQSRGARWEDRGGWGAPNRESGAPPPGPEIWSRFRAGAGLQTPVCRRVQAGARQMELTRRYRLRLCRLPKPRVAGSIPVSRSNFSPRAQTLTGSCDSPGPDAGQDRTGAAPRGVDPDLAPAPHDLGLPLLRKQVEHSFRERGGWRARSDPPFLHSSKLALLDEQRGNPPPGKREPDEDALSWSTPDMLISRSSFRWIRLVLGSPGACANRWANCHAYVQIFSFPSRPVEPHDRGGPGAVVLLRR